VRDALANTMVRVALDAEAANGAVRMDEKLGQELLRARRRRCSAPLCARGVLGLLNCPSCLHAHQSPTDLRHCELSAIGHSCACVSFVDFVVFTKCECREYRLQEVSLLTSTRCTVIFRPSVQSRVTHRARHEQFERDITQILAPGPSVNS
jgi:hypothetical protein